MIERTIQLPKNKSFFLFGPRQTGKTTLLKALFPKDTAYFYNLLDTEEYLRLSAHPSLLREEVKSRGKHIRHIVLDEIQKIPSLLDEIHLLLEESDPPYFVLSGSSARKLKHSHANMLGGRALTYRLFPLTALELKDKFSLHKVLRFGSLPAIYLENSEEIIAEQLRSYITTYLKEEIELEAQVRRIGQFIHFLTIAGFESGNILNYSNIARETGTTYQTVKSYFQILEDTLLGQFLYPYLKSTRKRLSKSPKFYLFDLGVTRALTKRITVPLEIGTSEFGRAFEHFVILEIMRFASYKKFDYAFSYYRTSGGAEVDLIIETPKGKILALEIKSSDIIAHVRGLKSFHEIVPRAKLCCISISPRKRKLGIVDIIPWQDMFEWLEKHS